MNKNQKILILIAVIFAILGVAGYFIYQRYFLPTGYIAFQQYNATKGQVQGEQLQQQNKNTNWKTYVNSEYGFSMQYPPDIAASAGVNEVNSLGEKGGTTTAINKNLFSIHSGVIEESTNLAIIVYVKDPNSTKWDDWSQIGVKSLENILLPGGVNGVLTTANSILSANKENNLSDIQFLSQPLKKGQKDYELIFQLNGVSTKDIVSSEKLFKGILSSFKIE